MVEGQELLKMKGRRLRHCHVLPWGHLSLPVPTKKHKIYLVHISLVETIPSEIIEKSLLPQCTVGHK